MVFNYGGLRSIEDALASSAVLDSLNVDIVGTSPPLLFS